MKLLKHCPLCRRGNFDPASAVNGVVRCDWCGNEVQLSSLDVRAIARIKARKAKVAHRVQAAYDLEETVFQLFCANARDGETMPGFFERVWTEFDVMQENGKK